MHFQITLTRPSQIMGLGRRGFSDKAYLRFCEDNPDLQVERSVQGGIVIVPPAGLESEDRNMEVITQLRTWAKRDGRGRVTGPTAQFFLPDGSAMSPDAAWTSNQLLSRASYEERRRFPYLCPEFIVEVRSPSDRLNKAKAKMNQWISNGARLAWLIDADRQTVCVYQPNQPVETRKGIMKLAGKGPVGPHRAARGPHCGEEGQPSRPRAGSVVRRTQSGFVLQLRTIWEGLK